MDQRGIVAKVEEDGWCVLASRSSDPDDLLAEVQELAQSLGEIALGRGRQLVERIIPHTAPAAVSGSLSSRYGLGTLPLHTDTAHWARPCRYLVMACANIGPTPTPTLLLDARHVRLSEPEEAACRNALFLVRNGRHSFYTSIRERDRPFIRLDPGCMAALSYEGQLAIRAFGSDHNRGACYRHDWDTRVILVIDNWRVLHGRGDGGCTEPGRVLLRAMIR